MSMNNKHKVPVYTLGLQVLLLLLVLYECESEGQSTKPNVVIIFADDLGYGDLSLYGHPTSSTPNLDLLASEGLVFTQFYTASPVCSPSRAALLTGRYQTRSGIYPGVLFPNNIGGLPSNETTIADSLKEVGYSTAIVGKWHLGVGENYTHLPTRHGFDYYLGIPYSQDMCPANFCFYPDIACHGHGRGTKMPLNIREQDPKMPDAEYVPCPVFEKETIIQQPADFLTLTSTYVNGATSFIKTKAASGSPFFLYFAFQHTHMPQFAGKMFTNSSIRGPFGDALSELDWGVGQLMHSLKDAGVENNTLVFFTADNGPALAGETNGGNAGPLRCGKGTTWEGGQRVPGIARWPGKITPGTRTHELAATLDLFPTIAKLTGGKLPDVTLDGFDMSPILFSNEKSAAKSNRNFYIYYSSDVTQDLGIAAIRLNQYKAHYHSKGGVTPDIFPDVICRRNFSLHHYDPPLLYDLHHDPSEIYNLDTTLYSDVMDAINKLKSQFESGMEWGESQMHEVSNNVEPCAKPGCSPFPSCCRTPPSSFTMRLDKTSRVIP